MSEYIDQLVNGFVTKGQIEKFDSLKYILNNSVWDSFSNATSEQGLYLAKQLNRMYRSINIRVTDNGYYDSTMDVSTMSDVQLAYLKGEIASLLNMVNHVNSIRPPRATWELAKNNLSLLNYIANNNVPYAESEHEELYSTQLINVYWHGEVRYCALTHLSKDLIAFGEDIYNINLD